ncbi:MAG: carboxypeptidase-like regulatory domain-containing protein [Bacteroidota bacterium]|nr:carboxypeptidase-like regulatory domain-containing protein [Bacteroidota bacterium]
MNPDLQKKLEKYEMLQQLLHSRPEITSRVTQMTYLIFEFDNAIALINEISYKNIASIAYKQSIKSRLISMTVDYSQKIQSYAIDQQKVFLQSTTLFSVDALDKLPTNELLKASNQLYNIIDIHLKDLDTFSLNQETQVQYKTAILLCEKTLDNVSSFSVEDYFTVADRILYKIEKRVKDVRIEEPEFHLEFRKVIKLHQIPIVRPQRLRPLANTLVKGCVKGNVYDTETGKAIPEARITFKKFAHLTPVLEINTLRDGSFNNKWLQVGKYDVTISHANYRTQTFSVMVTKDKDCVITTSLKKAYNDVIPQKQEVIRLPE